MLSSLLFNHCSNVAHTSSASFAFLKDRSGKRFGREAIQFANQLSCDYHSVQEEAPRC